MFLFQLLSILPFRRVSKSFVEETEYWKDPRIHVFGNVGVGGKMHANLASLATYLIDTVAYNGEDIRKRVLSESVSSSDTVVDLCCGIGKSTLSIGVDTSEEMIDVAKGRASNISFIIGNAETFGETKMADVCTIFFSLHEMPRIARRRVVDNALRIARKKVVVLDISPTYSPSESMLFGEPYLLDYLDNIQNDLENFDEDIVVEGHATVWIKEK